MIFNLRRLVFRCFLKALGYSIFSPTPQQSVGKKGGTGPVGPRSMAAASGPIRAIAVANDAPERAKTVRNPFHLEGHRRTLSLSLPPPTERSPHPPPQLQSSGGGLKEEDPGDLQSPVRDDGGSWNCRSSRRRKRNVVLFLLLLLPAGQMG